jgi:hypothetical protein
VHFDSPRGSFDFPECVWVMPNTMHAKNHFIYQLSPL